MRAKSECRIKTRVLDEVEASDDVGDMDSGVESTIQGVESTLGKGSMDLGTTGQKLEG
jgi:hypothetical protein